MSAPAILSAIACNLDDQTLTAALPLLEAGQVEAVEWSFDTLFDGRQLPDWFVELLTAYGEQGRLVGHGVYFSLLSGRWTPEQAQWLEQLRLLAGRFRFDHITEHFGAFTGQNFHTGAPLPVPYTAATLRLGQDRLLRVADACQCPVGLENLAFAYSLEEVQRHGEFLEQLVAPVNGFLLLDLHNLYCQLHNFNLLSDSLLALYPLHRVREIHISGGSWEDSRVEQGRQIRRDTHDEAVPDEVFSLLKRTIPKCPQLKYVVLEQLGTGLRTDASQDRFRQDFQRMAAIVEASRCHAHSHQPNAFQPPASLPAGPAAHDETIHTQQRQLAQILETAASYEEAQQRLRASSLAHTDWQLEQWAPHMLETAVRIAQKWKQ
ncbi:DUF692 domain-containing protein [Hymenobacter aerilatus]|uniref:DUF692 domain-containing protein n=1 Tax=Hymenobacter aerilatus TaxID=2932251 RepID=A0A8T9T3Y7_9BACT|nr:DUF692 family multinuclear iron-containing protein [Hymenobacter aerilatus]UOR06816.1 DUF692 domain-containing protein [Hymenobacter aerilatus]